MKASSPISSAASGASRPSLLGQTPHRSAAHTEAFEALRIGSTADLRTFTRDAATQMNGLLPEYQSYGAVVQPVGSSSIGDISVRGDTAAAVSSTRMIVVFIGFFTPPMTADTTWTLVYSGGRWLVAGLEIAIN